jgi:hypothetical protein
MFTSLQLALHFRNFESITARCDTLRPMNRRMFLGHAVTLDGEGFLPVRTGSGIGVALNDDAVRERADPEFHPL